MTQVTLITVDDLRDRFDIDGDSYPDPRVTPPLRSASRRLKEWAGDTLYASALANAILLAANPPGAQPSDADAVLCYELQNIEANLTMHYAILGFNSPITSKGVVATSMSNEGKEIRKYLPPKETAELAQSFLDLAFEIWTQVKTTIVHEAMPVIDKVAASGEGATRGIWCGACEIYHPFGFVGSCNGAWVY